MKSSELARLYPQLFHMAEDGSWPSIQRFGLLSTTKVLETWDVDTAIRADILTTSRTEMVRLEHPEKGVAVIRDQKPIHLPSLAAALPDMTTEEWLAELNSRVFFFVQAESLSGLLRSPSYRSRPHTVLIIDTARFIRAHEGEIELTELNSGFAQRHNHKVRGRDSFVPLAEFTHPYRDVARVGSRRDVVELCVKGAVADIVDHVVRVERRQGDEVPGRIL